MSPEDNGRKVKVDDDDIQEQSLFNQYWSKHEGIKYLCDQCDYKSGP